MKKLKYLILLSTLFLFGQSKVSAFGLSCTYEDVKNNRIVYYNLENNGPKDTNGENELFYYKGEDKYNISMQCHDTSDGCLYSLGIMATREGELSCPTLYVSTIDGSYTIRYMGDGMPYEKVKLANKECDYPNCNYYEQVPTNVQQQSKEIEKKSTPEDYRKRLESCGLSDIPIEFPMYISKIINLIKILVPIFLVIMGMLDFVRAVISSDEKQMKESQSRFIRRLLAGAIVFFVIAIVQFVFSAIGQDDKFTGCIACFVSGDCTASIKQAPPACYQCISDSSKYLWQSSNPGKTASCPAGYYKTKLTNEECGPKVCYQCNANGSIYKWAKDGQADTACPSGYHLIQNKTEEQCH